MIFCSELLKYPDIKRISFLKAFQFELTEKIVEIKNMLHNVSLIELQQDYSKLFIGPYKLLANPYGSIYLEPGEELYGKSTFDVLEYYSKYNLKINDDTIPDHICLELEFLYVLQQERIKLLETEKSKQYDEITRVQNQFVTEHIGLWIEKFAAKLAANSETTIYHDLGIVLPWLVKVV